MNLSYNMDCMEYMEDLPDNAFELAVVDPPYGIGENPSKAKTRNRPSKKYKNPKPKSYEGSDWDNVRPTQKYFDLLFRVSKNQVIWGGNYFTMFLPASMGWIYWNKKVKCDFSKGELAFTSFEKALSQFDYLWSGFAKKKPIQRIHPTQKPAALYKWILKNYAKPGDKILDTHEGSGSLKIACHDMGFDYVGTELDADYFRDSQARFKQHIAQGDLFTPEERQEHIYNEGDLF